MSKKTLLILCTFLAAIIGAYLLGRTTPETEPADTAGVDTAIVAAEQTPGKLPPSTTRPTSVAVALGVPLPAPGVPLKATFTDLQARANAGDAVAATRLFRDLDRCNRLRGSEWRNKGVTGDLANKKTDGMSPEQLRTYQILFDTMKVRQQSVHENQALCAGVSDEMLDTLVPNLAQAARLGDEDARACYLGRGPLYDARSLLAHPETLQAYRNNTSAMMEAGLAAGDWRVVDLLQQAYEPGAQGLLAGLVGADPVQHYRYLRLYRLGAEQHRVARLDQQLAAAAANLTSAQLADADQWAQTTLRGNFKGDSTSATPQGWEACAF